MNDSEFSPEEIIKSVATDVAALSAENIVTVIEKANDIGKAIDMGDYLNEQRPDLEDEIEDAVGGVLARFD